MRAHAASPYIHSLLACATALCFSCSTAWADDYADVNQLLRSGKAAEALAKADQYLAGKPRDPQMRFLKGVIQTETGRTTEAISTFIKLTEEYPELPEPYNNLAVLYAGQSQFDKARAALEMAIRTNPSYATAHENLGDVYAKLASQAYSKALQLDASNTGVQPKLALIRELFAPVDKPAAKPASAAAAPSTPTASRAVALAKASATAPLPSKPQAQTFINTPAQTVRAASASPTSASVSNAAPAAASNIDKEVEAAVQAWAAAWSAKDLNSYLAAYGSEFVPPGKQSRRAWEDERRARIAGKSHISVKVSEFSVAANGNRATVRFKQAYSGDGLNISSHKTLDLAKSAERWLIIKESNGA